MKQLFNRFEFSAAKFSGLVWLCLGIIWLLVLWCTIASIRSKPFSARQRKFWILTVCLAPVVGTLAYLPFSCRWDYLAQLFFIRVQRKPKKNSDAESGPSDGGRGS